MIVDDESIIRDGLTNMIEWEKFGYKVIAQAANGEKAFELAIDLKPNIIITDIFMPVMDGIELAKKVKYELPQTVIIFLSGYNEFVYAQKAVEIGIFRYLTKPIREEELLLTLQDARKDLEHKVLEEAQIKKLESLIRESIPLIKERFFISLIKGLLNENEITNKLKYLNIEISEGSFICIVINIDNYFNLVSKSGEADIYLIKFAVKNISEEILSGIDGQIFTFEDNNNDLGILVCFKEKKNFNYQTILYPMLQKIQDAIRMYYNITVSIGLGRVYNSLSEVFHSYMEAKCSIEYKATFGRNSIIFIDDIEPSENLSLPDDIFEKITELFTAIKNADIEFSNRIINEVFISLKGKGSISLNHLKLVVIEMINKLTKVTLEYGGDVTEIFGKDFLHLSLFNFDTPEEISNKIGELIKKEIDFIIDKRQRTNRNFIEKAKEYIKNNYMLEDLDLGIISEHIHVSSAYLSRLFKQVTGETCIEFTNKIKINQSKKLLKETNLKLYEIAYKVGYSDAQYFSTCFKKYEGISPTDFRDLITKDFLE